ncbi:SecDF P1 head subdomain-containing protein [Devosia lucknowensis]|uniref:SecDF P1 head subdomain-containing protein n=1 Tax=Devosia lucknowensis TaxID=1096929 RepID=UPI001123F0B0|nr:hypothetical protein [Devosia lucknowensis]
MKSILAAVALLALAAPAVAQSNTVLEVMSASVGRDDQTGQPALKISLTGDGRAGLAEFTARHVNRVVDVLVEGAVVTSPWIGSPLDSDWIIVTGPFSGSELDAMAEQINRGSGEVVLRARKDKSRQ